MNRLTLSASALTLALGLAACSQTQNAITPVATQPSGPVLGSSPVSPTSLAARINVQTLAQMGTNALPQLSGLQRTAGDSSDTQVVVGYQDAASLQALAEHFGARVVGDIPELHSALLTLPPQLSGRKTIEALGRMVAGVRFAAANGHDATLGDLPVTRQGTPKIQAQAISGHDPLFPKQWWLKQVGADQVRNVATGKGVVVGVVDTDFDRLHEDLKADGKIVPGIDTSAPYLNLVIPPDLPLLSGSHGSGSAGTIAERTGNGIGGEGVAPDAILMPIRIFNERGYTGDFNVAFGIVWAVNHGAKVLNNSWGGGGYSPFLAEAVNYALLHNVVVVASAGNDFRDLHNGIESYPGVISVGASAGDDKKADFSNIGPRVDLYAPGDNGLTTEVDESLTDARRESSYGLFGGTSMAGPVVAGGAALILDRAAQLGMSLTPYQVKRLVSDTGDAMKDPKVPEGKRLNLVKALDFTPAKVPTDGGYVGVRVTSLVDGSAAYGTDVILTPLNGQNKGLDYLAKTSLSAVGGQNAFPGGDIDPNTVIPANQIGMATFAGIEPGDYEVKVAGPGVDMTYSFGGARTYLVGKIKVKGGVQNAQILKYQIQVDGYEYLGYDRNGTPATANDLSIYPVETWQKGVLLGAAFDNSYTTPPYPGAPAGAPDEDYYKLTVPAGKTLTVSSYGYKFGSRAEANLSFTDVQGVPLDAAANVVPMTDPQGDAEVTFTAKTDQDVYVKATNERDGNGLGFWYGIVVKID